MRPGEGTDGRSVRSRCRGGFARRRCGPSVRRIDNQFAGNTGASHRVTDTPVRRVRATQLFACWQLGFQFATVDSEPDARCQKIFLDKHFAQGSRPDRGHRRRSSRSNWRWSGMVPGSRLHRFGTQRRLGGHSGKRLSPRWTHRPRGQPGGRSGVEKKRASRNRLAPESKREFPGTQSNRIRHSSYDGRSRDRQVPDRPTPRFPAREWARLRSKSSSPGWFPDPTPASELGPM